MSSEREFQIKSLTQLSFPKSGYPKCDLTGARAAVELITPYVTIYYASYELAENAWFGIVKKIDHLIAPLKEEAPIVGTQEERARRLKLIETSKRSLIEYCLSESSNLMSMEKYQLAIPAAVQALKYCEELDGEKSLSIVEPNLHLGQAFLGVKEFSKALENLSLARWIILNNDNCSFKTRSRLHMLLGRVLTAQGSFEEAKNEYSEAIYYSSCYSGAEAVPTSMGYFRLGDVFLAQSSVDPGLGKSIHSFVFKRT